MWNQTIIQAITSLKLIKLTYDGQVRIVEPHVLGYKNHELELLTWQLINQSELGNKEGWRTFQLNKIGNLQMIDQSFNGIRSTKSSNHTTWDSIVKRVSN